MPNSIQVNYVGKENSPICILDGFYADLNELFLEVGQGEGFASNENDYYPGVKMPVKSQGYNRCLHGIAKQLIDIFELPKEATLNIVSCDYAISNKAADQLLPIQSIPHFDTFDEKQIAAVHYLCDEHHGGTSFYRHKLTQYEVITKTRFQQYQSVLGRQATTEGLPEPGFINGSTNLFERVGQTEAELNRIIFYRSNMLHSGNINNVVEANDSIRAQRLTIVSNLQFI